jgi:hypothetical protein
MRSMSYDTTRFLAEKYELRFVNDYVSSFYGLDTGLSYQTAMHMSKH